MPSLPRILCIMGSGETTPTMAKLHRELFERVGVAPAVILDTPYGFQSNADDISARAARYFKESTGRTVEIARLPRAEGSSPVYVEAAQARVASAGWVFSGPGSPTYALRQWHMTSVPSLLADKLASGGCLIFSSAAALTLGHFTVPVYEIYKAGADPNWHEGLDLLGSFGLDVAVVPHYDNAEGGTHDTRYCYLGEERLELLESQLPADAWVLGIDEHTACVFDFEDGSVSVRGLGGVTVRHGGEERMFAAGATLEVSKMPALALSISNRGGTRSPSLSPVPTADGDERPGAFGLSSGALRAPRLPAPVPPHPRESPFLTEMSRIYGEFDNALAAGDAHGATESLLGLETSMHEWSADTFESDEIDRARGIVRRALLRLGEAAGPGLVDPGQLVGPWVGALLRERDEARSANRYADADRIRDFLLDAGVEVRDGPTGTEWQLRAER